MFDDISTNQAPPPGNLPLEPEDMFSGVDDTVASTSPQAAPVSESQASPVTPTNALDAGMLRKKTAESVMAPSLSQPVALPVSYAVKGPVIGKVLIVFFAGVAVVGVSLAGWWGYNRLFAKSTAVQTPTPSTPVAQPPAPVVTPPAPVVTVTDPGGVPGATNTVSTKIQNDQILFGEIIDTDKDGIDDQREKEVGTDVAVPDTDTDGLTDGQEVLMYKTDPLNTDTDGDGYPDGQEVRNNYNPRGPGKLPASTP